MLHNTGQDYLGQQNTRDKIIWDNRTPETRLAGTTDHQGQQNIKDNSIWDDKTPGTRLSGTTNHKGQDYLNNRPPRT